MKRIFLFFICATLVGACKKNSSSSKEILLSKVLLNGELETEFIYNSERQLIEEKIYDDDLGFTALDYRYEYIYDANGNPKEMTGYNLPENKATSRYVYTVNSQGRIERNAI